MVNPSKERIKRYLKKNINVKIDEKPTESSKKEFINRKLFSEAPRETMVGLDGYQQQSSTFWQRLRRKVDQRLMGFDGKGFKTFKKETFPFLMFISFSTFILYKMEQDYAKMAATVTKVKTQKQQIAEEEDEYIRQHLVAKDKIGKNQIQDVPDKRGLYKFEQFDDEDGDFSTKEDFYDLLRKDHNKGIELPDQYSQAVREYSFQNNKKFKYGEFEDGDEEEEDTSDIVLGTGNNNINNNRNFQQQPRQF